MKRAARAVWALSVVCIVSFGATVLAQQAAAPAAKPKFVEPVHGFATINVLKPVTKVKGNEVVTTLSVKNAMAAPIAGLKLDEYWYDKAGNVVTGDSKRMPKPLQPGEIYVFELHSPKDPRMNRNSYQFSHANGKIKAESVAKF